METIISKILLKSLKKKTLYKRFLLNKCLVKEEVKKLPNFAN